MVTARSTVLLCIGLLIALKPYAIGQQPEPTGTPPGAHTLLSPGELDSLVAPVALYPDPILSQVLVASTYPLEIVEAARWLETNNNLSGKALADAVAQQPWDASVQALVLLPEVLKRLNQEVRWTTELGNAFMEQEEDVMQAIQRMRQKASANGALHSTAQQTVRTSTENGKTFIVIEPASPDVVYVPVYNPVAVWGPAVYPFPAISYPPYTGVARASALSFGMGMAVGGFWGGGWRGWGWNPGWGRNNIIVNNNFFRSNRFNRVNVGEGNRWVRGGGRRAGVRSTNRGGNRAGNIGGNRGNRPTAEQTRRRLAERGGGGRPWQQANIGGGQRGNRRAGQGSAARAGRGAFGERQQFRRSNAGQGRANRIGQGNAARVRQNRGGNRGVYRGANRGGARSAHGNRGFANRSAGRSRGAGGGFRGGAARSRGGGGGSRGGAARARGGGGSRGGAARARGGGGSRGGGRRR